MKLQINISNIVGGMALGILIMAFTHKTPIDTIPGITLNLVNHDHFDNGIRAYMKAMRQIESRDDYTAHRKHSEYVGAYQMDDYLRTKLGYDSLNNSRGYKYILSHPKIQDKMMYELIAFQLNELRYLILKYDNKQVGRWHITTSGILAMTHLMGESATKNFLTKGIISRDGNKVPITDYLQLNGFNLYKN